MAKKIIFTLASLIFLFIIFIITNIYIIRNTITYSDEASFLKLSELIEIEEERVIKQKSIFFKNEFIGFNAIIDNEYYVTLLKIGNITTQKNFKQIIKMPSINKDLNFFTSNDTLDLNFMLIDINQYPYKIQKIDYYIGNNEAEVKKEKFFEIITKCTKDFQKFDSEFSTCDNIYISFNNKMNSDFGISSFKINNSYSFINHKKDIYLITLYAFSENKFKSLHELINLKKL